MTGAVAQYLAAAAGQPPLAQQINQFFSNHPTTYIWAGNLQANQSTAGTGSTTSNGLYIAQSFATAASQTTIGYIGVDMQVTVSSGSVLGPLTIGIYANAAGAPTGSALVSNTFTVEYCFSQGTFTYVPMYVSGLTPSTTYWIVTNPQGTGVGGADYPWMKSNQASGTSTSTNGTTWTAQTYGSMYQVYDQAATGNITFIYEDGGARQTYLGFNASGQITRFDEYTTLQGGGYLQSTRALTYSNGFLLAVT